MVYFPPDAVDFEVARLAGHVAFNQDAVRVAIGKGRYTGTAR